MSTVTDKKRQQGKQRNINETVKLQTKHTRQRNKPNTRTHMKMRAHPRVLASVVDYVNANPSARVAVNHALRDAQNVCALTKVGAALKTLNTHNLRQQ